MEGPPGRQPDRALAEVLDGFSETGADWSAHSLGNVEDLMSTEPITARPEELVSTVARRMAEEEVHRIVVVDGDSRPMGIITTLDLLAVFPE